MNVLSLFSGIGGLDLGLERAGFTIAGQVEIDPWCRKVLAKHWPEVPKHDDVRTCIEWWGGRRAPDIVCGGFPCQPVSLAGKREGQADSRWLWPAFAATVRALRPRYVLVENTPGLASLGMGDVVGDLAALGYDAEWDCIPACWVGAPHVRERIFLVAYPASIGRVGADDGQREHAAARRAERPAAEHQRFAGEAGSEPRILADAAGSGHAPDSRGVHGNAGAHRAPVGQFAGRGGADVAYSGSPQGRIWPGRWQQLTEGGRVSRFADQWGTEPGMGRVAHGIPDRLDRIRGLGNAVVPQVAEHIGRMIMDAGRTAA